MNADAVVKVLFGLLISILGFMGVDTLRRIRHLENDTLRRADLANLQTQLASEHADNKQDISANSQRLSGIEDSVRGVHARIDDLFKALAK